MNWLDVLMRESIPEEVKRSFSHRYPGVQPSNWLVKNGRYSVSFPHSGKLRLVVMNNRGSVVYDFVAADIGNVPRHIIRKAMKQHVGLHLDHTMLDKARSKYRLMLSGSNKHLNMVLDEGGRVIEMIEYP